MQLTPTNAYALRPLALIARRGGEPSSVQSICDTLGAPKKHVTLTPGHREVPT